MENYPPNSRTAAAAEEKKVERVTSAEASRRKKPLGARFKETFIGGDARSVVQYVFFEVMMPAAKDMLVDAGSQGIERFIFGESRTGGRRVQNAVRGHIAYNRMSQPQARPSMSRGARARFDFDEVVLQSRGEADDVIDRLYELLSKYESVTVSDLYELVGIRSEHTDTKWGWTDLRGAGVSRLRSGGYLLDLPSPQPLG